MGYIELTQLMWALIQRLGSQNKLAKALRQSRQKIHYWLHGDRQPPYEQILAMQTLLKKLIEESDQKKDKSYQRLVNSIQSKSLDTEIQSTIDKHLTLSQRAQWAMQQELELGSRRGYRINKEAVLSKDSLFYGTETSSSPGRDLIEKNRAKRIRAVMGDENYQGRTDERIAKLAGLGSARNYRRIKAILQKGAPALVEAIDTKIIDVKTAEKIARLPQAKQSQLISQGQAAIKAYFKESEPSCLINVASSDGNEERIIFFKDSKNIFNHAGLQQIEQETHLPLRFILVALSSACDATGKFQWQPTALKKRLIPFTDWDFEQVLEVLRAHGWVRKTHERTKTYGTLEWKHTT